MSMEDGVIVSGADKRIDDDVDDFLSNDCLIGWRKVCRSWLEQVVLEYCGVTYWVVVAPPHHGWSL